MTLSLMPLGCSSAKIYRPSVPDDRPSIPDATAERLRECVDELSGDINPGHYTLDASVKVDQEGHVVEVETTGQPNPDVGGCMRMALRGMTLPKELLTNRKLRMGKVSASAAGQAMPGRGQIGEVVIITIVTISFAEVFIEMFAATVVVAVTVAIAADGTTRPKGDDDDKRCREVKEKCIAYCSGSPGLPAPGGGRFRRCMRECMEAAGCSF